MSLEENKAVIRRLFEAENKRNLAILNELIARAQVVYCCEFEGFKSDS